MSIAFLVQLALSGLAVAILVGLCAWLGLPRDGGPITEERARAILAVEFPGRAVDRVVVSPDGGSAIGVCGDQALVLRRVGDGHAVHQTPLSALTIRRRVKDGVTLNGGEPGASPVRFALKDGEAWPPRGLSA